MNTVSAQSGWAWIQQGLLLYRKRPMELLSLFFLWMVLTQLLGFIPIAGQFISFFLFPVFSVGLIQACLLTENEQKIRPDLLFIGFKSPQLLALLGSGLLRMVAIIFAFWCSDELNDGELSTFMKAAVTVETMDAASLEKTVPVKAIFSTFLIYIPFLMAFWYSIPLMVWQRMSLFKSLFYSFFAVLHSWKALLVYFFCWYGITLLIGPLAVIFYAIDVNVGKLMLTIFSFIIFVIAFCSSYPTYTDVFGKPDQENQSAA
ncbi:BPSS1780 family membrane protein [Undibacterium sp. JH2W]|uniref:BPSS1780 family membrane protein n=1 Tax=Undibacterium sp. JH2W TaxID=3413037 RepID=UPI003BF433C5